MSNRKTYWRLVWEHAWADLSAWTGGTPRPLMAVLLALLVALPMAWKISRLAPGDNWTAAVDVWSLTSPAAVVLLFVLLLLAAPARIHAEQVRELEALCAQHVLEVAERDATIAAQRSPKGAFVLKPECCVWPRAVKLGVTATTPVTLRKASVYAEVAGHGDRVLAWETPGRTDELDIHHGGHNHTAAVAVVGDQPDEFFLDGFKYPPTAIKVGPGTYKLPLRLRSDGAEAVEATLEIVFQSKSVTVKLLPSP